MGSRVSDTPEHAHTPLQSLYQRELIKTDKQPLPQKNAEKENKNARSENSVGGTGGLQGTEGGTPTTDLKCILIRVSENPPPTPFTLCISQDLGIRILKGKAPHPYILIFKYAHLFLS